MLPHAISTYAPHRPRLSNEALPRADYCMGRAGEYTILMIGFHAGSGSRNSAGDVSAKSSDMPISVDTVCRLRIGHEQVANDIARREACASPISSPAHSGGSHMMGLCPTLSPYSAKAPTLPKPS